MDSNQLVKKPMFAAVQSQQEFANYVGVSIDTVRGWIECKTIPTVKIGRQRFINGVKFFQDLDEGKTIFVRGDYDE